MKNVSKSVNIWLSYGQEFGVLFFDLQCRCKAKPDCSPPGYPPRRQLIIVKWSVNWFAYVLRSTCTCCRIPSQANQSCGLTKQKFVYRGRCIGVANKTRRRSTLCITLTTVERVVAECIGHSDEYIEWIV